MAYHGISWYIMIYIMTYHDIYHDISWHIMTFLSNKWKYQFCRKSLQLQHFCRESLRLRALIAFEDALASSIARQVMPPWSRLFLLKAHPIVYRSSPKWPGTQESDQSHLGKTEKNRPDKNRLLQIRPNQNMNNCSIQTFAYQVLYRYSAVHLWNKSIASFR